MNFKSLMGLASRLIALGTVHLRDGINPMGRIRWSLIDANGSTLDASGKPYGTGVVKNMVVTTGKTYCAQRFVSNATAVVSHVAIGSGTTAPALGQTALTTETARAALSTQTNTANVSNLIGTIPAGTGTGTVEEVGLFNAAAGPTMIARALTGTIGKPAGLGLQFTWDVTHG